jgi:hypothetical protein
MYVNVVIVEIDEEELSDCDERDEGDNWINAELIFLLKHTYVLIIYLFISLTLNIS